MLYIFRFLHQTTTSGLLVLAFSLLYIFWFLHQTTTRWHHHISTWSCISFDSYIKPQRQGHLVQYAMVVYLLIPTSNHNLCSSGSFSRMVVYLLIPTSNHNFSATNEGWPLVVYLLIPTSNHNLNLLQNNKIKLYIFWFLHQTTTKRALSQNPAVVYLLIPTSNHNKSSAKDSYK